MDRGENVKDMHHKYKYINYTEESKLELSGSAGQCSVGLVLPVDGYRKRLRRGQEHKQTMQ